MERESLDMMNLITNSIKSAILGRSQDQMNKLNESFGYKVDLLYHDFYNLYKRTGLAKRIIDATVDSTWKDFPKIVDEDDDANKVIKENEVQVSESKYTLFEEGIFELQKQFPLLRLCKKADTLNCLGRFSIMVIGTRCNICGDEDTRKNDLKEELPKGTSIQDIAFLSIYSESQVTISTWETNVTSERYGLPKMYQISVNGDGGVSMSHQVHYTRVIHIAEDLLESEVYGTPKLEAIYNNLQDMLKVVGGSAEMFWLGAYQGLVFNVKDGFTLDDASRAAMTEEIENYTNKLQRFMKTKGVEVTTLTSPTADPRGNVEVLLKLISGASNIPLRILIGAENGVYAGNTDQDTFYSYISSRRNSFAEEQIIRPLIDRLVDYGYIAAATNNEYFLKWTPLVEPSITERYTNANALVAAAKAADPYGDALKVITREEIRGALGLDEEMPETKMDPFADDDMDLDNIDLLDITQEGGG